MSQFSLSLHLHHFIYRIIQKKCSLERGIVESSKPEVCLGENRKILSRSRCQRCRTIICSINSRIYNNRSRICSNNNRKICSSFSGSCRFLGFHFRSIGMIRFFFIQSISIVRSNSCSYHCRQLQLSRIRKVQILVTVCVFCFVNGCSLSIL